MDDIDFEEDTAIKSVRKSTNRRRRDPVDEDNLDAVLDSVLTSSSTSKVSIYKEILVFYLDDT